MRALIEARLRAADASLGIDAVPASSYFVHTVLPYRVGIARTGLSPRLSTDVVWYLDSPVWCMAYRAGACSPLPGAQRAVAMILHDALGQSDPASPTGRPRWFKGEESLYVNTFTGSLEGFVGREEVYWRDTLVWFSDFMGGVISTHPSHPLTLGED